MDANITISLEEFPDLGGTMSREIVGDDMSFLCWCLTVDAEYRCIDRRLEIQTDDIGGFFLELRIVTGKIAPQSMRLQPSFGQDARDPDVVGANLGGNLAS